eukprot:14127341-Alexandrium_andersonii.AAC.1
MMRRQMSMRRLSDHSRAMGRPVSGVETASVQSRADEGTRASNRAATSCLNSRGKASLQRWRK